MLDKRLAVYSGSHLVIDFACFFIVTGSFAPHVSVVPGLYFYGVFIYNLIAFALQAPLGYAIDLKRVRPFAMTMTGSLIVAAGVAAHAWPWVALVVVALGNACFHLGGGIDSLVNAQGRYTRPGVFISFGALGVVLGTWTGTRGWLPVWAVMALLMVCAGLQYLVREARPWQGVAVFKLATAPIRRADVAILVLMFVIVVRALAGPLVDTPWKTGVLFTIVAAACVAAGKFTGGILADRFGARNVAVVSLVVSAPLLTVWSGSIVAGCVGLLCFNIMTAVTLVTIASRLPGRPGFAFGLTTLALFAGTSIAMLFVISPAVRVPMLVGLIGAAVVSMILTTTNRGAPSVDAQVASAGVAATVL